MKKIIFLLSIVLITFASCKKESATACYTYYDCLGNSLTTSCGISESDAQAYCTAHSTAGCIMTYKKQ